MELYPIPIPGQAGRFILYRPRLGLAFVGNTALVRLVSAYADGQTAVLDTKPAIRAFLDSLAFFTPDPPDLPQAGGVFRPCTAVLLLTNQCQLRCTYCYAAAGEAERQELTPELGFAAIDQVCQNALEAGRDRFEVTFHGGGEPTFAWTTLQVCTEYARQKPLPAKITMVSNGVWSPAQTEWILANLEGVTISMDGTPHTQDQQRPLVSGQGSSELVLKTITALDAHQFDYGIRMTATAPWETLPQGVRFICEHTACQQMQVEPAFNLKRGGHHRPDTSEAEGFSAAYLEALHIASSHGRSLSYSGARLGMITNAFCSAPYDALIVNGNGDVVTCYEVASPAHALSGMSVIGHIRGGQVQIDTAARDHLHGLMAERRAACQGCFCYWSCAGDCYARSFEVSEGGHQRRDGRCQINQHLTRELLLARMAENGGLWCGVQAVPHGARVVSQEEAHQA
ncbi:MAG: SPASM domain-containing protein [Anaerolinea sp.]|nr:SPASM domain-containing protein [Anaerolinea sp.]